MKVIFLDVDGVLLHNAFDKKYFEENGVWATDVDALDPLVLSRLRRLISATGAEVVISSTWRWDETAMEHLREQFNEYNISIFDTTRIEQYPVYSREKDVRLYLAQHPDIEAYVILDDIHFEKDPELLAHQICCDANKGFTEANLLRAFEILTNKE